MGFALYPASRIQYVFRYIILTKVANVISPEKQTNKQAQRRMLTLLIKAL